MNIYKTKDGTYINMEQVTCIQVEEEIMEFLCVNISLTDESELTLYKEEAKAFLEYLDNHLLGVYAGAA